MNIVTTKPPIWDKAHEHFDLDDERTVYTYGENLHNPANLEIDEFLLAHEATHTIQQAEHQGGPAGWWDHFFDSPTFRAEQEATAYGQQYRAYCEKHADRNQRALYLHQLVTFLSSSMYKAGMTQSDARAAIMARSQRKITLSPKAPPHSPEPEKPKGKDWL